MNMNQNKEVYNHYFRNLDLLIQLVSSHEQLAYRERNLLLNSIICIHACKELSDSYSSAQKIDADLRLKLFNTENFPDIQPIKFKNVLTFYSTNGFYYFKFKDPETAKKFKATREFIKFAGYGWDGIDKVWYKKRRIKEFDNIDALIEIFNEKIETELKAVE